MTRQTSRLEQIRF